MKLAAEEEARRLGHRRRRVRMDTTTRSSSSAPFRHKPPIQTPLAPRPKTHNHDFAAVQI
jgi:hypothetical protein